MKITENKLWNWFGLSHATYLTIPRVLLHEMPIKWQNKLATLLEEYDNLFPSLPPFSTRVMMIKNKKPTLTPEWIKSYRHPYKQIIANFKKDIFQ